MEDTSKLESVPWAPTFLLKDLELMIEEEPDIYPNDDRATLILAKDFLEDFFHLLSLPEERAIERLRVLKEVY